MKELEQPGVCLHCGYRPDQTGTEGHYLRPYTILNGKYLVGRVLGEGGFGITYIGYDLNLEMPVAIKEFYPNGFVTRESSVTSMVSAYRGTNMEAVSKWKNNFIKEARSLAKCAHLSGIVGVKDFFEENGTAYIVMEYLEGITLKAYIKSNGGKVEADQLLNVLEPVIDSLIKVHEYGLIHRDISPDNIMLLQGGVMKLLDFGAARDFASGDEKSLSVMLKPGYAPEEQYRTKGKQGPWSDVYAFAATIYKCVTGVTPPEAMERMRKDELKKPGEMGIAIDAQTEAAILKGMEVYAENRYQSMSEFKEALYAGQRRPYEAQTAQQLRMEIIGGTDGEAETATGVTGQEQPKTGVTGTVSTGQAGAPKKIKEVWQNHRIPVLAGIGILLAVIIIAVPIAFGKKEEPTQTAEETAAAESGEPVTAEEQAGTGEQAAQALQSAKEKMEEGDYETAYEFLEMAKNLNPEETEIYSLGPDILMQRGEAAAAVALLEEGIGITGASELDEEKQYLLENAVLEEQEIYKNGTLTSRQYYDRDKRLVRIYWYNENEETTGWEDYVYNGNTLISQIRYYENGVQENGTAYNEDGSENIYASYDRDGTMTYLTIALYENGPKMSKKLCVDPAGLSIHSSIDEVYMLIAGGATQSWMAYEYDGNGNLVRDINYNQDGSISSWQDYYYDENGNSTGYRAYRADGTVSAYGEYQYDDMGYPVIYTEYNEDGSKISRSEYSYDAWGSCEKEWDYYGDGDAPDDEIEYVNGYRLYEDVQTEDEYVLPYSDTRLVSKQDLQGLTKEECRLARNELYARHGRRFGDGGELQTYFDSKSWYEGTVDGDDFKEGWLNEVEISNRNLISSYEKEMGYR